VRCLYKSFGVKGLKFFTEGKYLDTSLFCNTWPPHDSSVTKLFIPPSDRRLRRTTKSKLPSERALNRHSIPGHTNHAQSLRQPFNSNTGLRYSREMAVATKGLFQMLRSLCVIDTNFTILRHSLLKLWRNDILR
jgi:hypothetical protein